MTLFINICSQIRVIVLRAVFIYMKKLIFLLGLSLIFTLPAKASFDNNIRYGTKNSDFVKEIQEFLTDQALYSGPITGNFYTLTLKAVKSFQKREGIKADGYWGPETRSKANDLLSPDIQDSEDSAIQSGENLPTSNNEVAFRFMDGSGINYNGEVIESPNITTTPSVPDFCFNIPGNQQVLPQGYYREVDNNCYQRLQDNITVPVTNEATKNDSGEIICYGKLDSVSCRNSYQYTNATFTSVTIKAVNSVNSDGFNVYIQNLPYYLKQSETKTFSLNSVLQPNTSNYIAHFTTNHQWDIVELQSVTYTVNGESKSINFVWNSQTSLFDAVK